MREISHVIDSRRIKFLCPNELTCARASTFWVKEPGTLAWIGSFEPGSTFWDIGANVGLYSIYAAALKHRVYAFEPVASNYDVLVRNVVINEMDRAITALPIALASKSCVSHMAMRDNITGSAHHTLGGHNGKWRQGAMSVAMDTLHTLFDVPFADHIKIDVDGNELDILHGGELALMMCRSVMVEVKLSDEKKTSEIRKLLSNAGLREDRSLKENTVRPGTVFNLHYSRS